MEAQGQTGHNQGVAGEAVSSEGLTEGTSVSKLTQIDVDRSHSSQDRELPQSLAVWASPSHNMGAGCFQSE